MDSFLISSGFNCFHFDPIVYTQRWGIDLLIMILYVDEFILTRSSSSMIHSVQKEWTGQFDMTYLGLLHFFLGL
jgi:hypothetical protein